MAAPRRNIGVQAPGLRKLNRDLGKISRDFGRGAVNYLRDIGKRVHRTAKADAMEQRVTGELARSYRVSAGQRGTAITSRLPQAGVLEFGGEIAPRGVPFQIEPHEFIVGAIEEHAGEIDERFGDLLDRIARGNGFPRL
jgi:hypothetical protein